jgi:hypothetical protein
MHISRSLSFRLILFAGFLVSFDWLGSLTVIGSEVWEAHLKGLTPLQDLAICASPWLCLLVGILTVTGRFPLRYAAPTLGLFLVLGLGILRFWYVPYNPELKQWIRSHRSLQLSAIDSISVGILSVR